MASTQDCRGPIVIDMTKWDAALAGSAKPAGALPRLLTINGRTWVVLVEDEFLDGYCRYLGANTRALPAWIGGPPCPPA